MSLPEDDPDVFEDFLHWVYTGEYRVTEYRKGESGRVLQYRALIDLYCFAEKIQIPTLQNLLIDKFYYLGVKSQVAPGVPNNIARYLYELPDYMRPMRQIVLAFYMTTVGIDRINMHQLTMQAMHDHPKFAVEYIRFAGLRYGTKQKKDLASKGAAYFYDDVLEKEENKFGGLST